MTNCESCEGYGFHIKKKYICNGCCHLNVSSCCKCENVNKIFEECKKCLGSGKK